VKRLRVRWTMAELERRAAKYRLTVPQYVTVLAAGGNLVPAAVNLTAGGLAFVVVGAAGVLFSFGALTHVANGWWQQLTEAERTRLTTVAKADLSPGDIDVTDGPGSGSGGHSPSG
jgi:hypothetical protein